MDPPRLERNQIRLLTVDCTDGVLDCTLSTHYLTEAVEYYAVSYAWEGQEPSRAIRCNGCETFATATVYELLSVLAEHGPKPQRPIWIDSVCINQADASEMSDQIPLMRDIYTRAKQTIIWLGKDDKDSDAAMDCIPSLSALVDPTQNYAPGLREKLQYELKAPPWQALINLCNRAWFDRLWTFQEAVIPAEKIIMCGDRTVDWNVFSMLFAPDSIYYTGLSAKSDLPVRLMNSTAAYEAVHNIEFMRTRPRTMHACEYICLLLDCVRRRNCSLAIDRLWGLLGLFPPSVRDFVSNQSWIDYSEEGRHYYWKSYIAFGGWLVAWDPTLRLLSMAPSQSRPPQLPTWCPNLHSAATLCSLNSYGDYRAGFVTVDDRQSRIEADGNHIRVPGFRLDGVVQSATLSGVPSLRNISDVFEWLDECASVYFAAAPKNPDRLENFARLMIGDVVEGLESHDVYDVYVEWRRFLDPRNSEAAPAYSPRILGMFEKPLHFVNSGRVLIRTASGRCGLAPAKALPGDIVCIFESATSPFVLRPRQNSDRYELIGDAYIQGVMFGELLSDHHEEEWFTID